MFFTLILPIILFILIVICDAAKDVIKSRWDGSFFDKHPKLFPKKWWDSRLSWKNKWVLDENGEIKLDENGERIPKKLFGIIDFPDAFTNGWHLFFEPEKINNLYYSRNCKLIVEVRVEKNNP